MKTPMQELLERVKEYRDSETDVIVKSRLNSVCVDIVRMLEKEEKLIMKIYNHAVLHGMLVELGKEEVISAKQYYNKTFKTKERCI